MANTWKTLSTEEKAPFEAKAKQDKNRYDTEKQVYEKKK